MPKRPSASILTEAIGFRVWQGSARPMDSFHRHNEIEGNLVLKGSLHYSFGHSSNTVGRGQLAIFWGSVPHRLDRCATGTKAVWFTVPLAWLLQWGLPRGLNTALLQGRLLIDRERGAFARDLPVFRQWSADFKRPPSDIWQPLLQSEIQNRLRRLALHLKVLPQGSEGRSSGSDAPRVEVMAKYLHERFASPVNAAGLARHLGLNRHYTQRLFRSSFGTSLVGYLTMLRLSQAQRLLASTDQKLVDLAMDCGYPSLSRFYEAFKKECGMTPRQYRKKVGGLL